MTPSNRPGWRHYRHCYACGVAPTKPCRDMDDRIVADPCEGRRLRKEPAEVIADDVVPAAPVKPRKQPTVVRVEVPAPAPVVIAGRVMVFDDVVAKPTAPVRCYDDELFPFTPIAKKVPKRPCAHCGVTLHVDGAGIPKACRRPACLRVRKAVAA